MKVMRKQHNLNKLINSSSNTILNVCKSKREKSRVPRRLTSKFSGGTPFICAAATTKMYMHGWGVLALKLLIIVGNGVKQMGTAATEELLYTTKGWDEFMNDLGSNL